MLRKIKGFTLIELMVVVVIIGILAAIAIPNFIRMQKRAKESDVKAVAHTLQLSVEDYKTTPGQEGIKPAAAADLVAVQTSYLPYNVKTKKNPFANGALYYGLTEITWGAPGTQGQVGYTYTFQTVQYTIQAWGGDVAPDIILTLLEGS